MLRQLERAILFAGKDRLPACRSWELVPGTEPWKLPTEEGEGEAWFLPAEVEGPAPAVFFAHGNGELIEDWARPFTMVAALGVHVLLAEYRGYGRSPGTPSERSITEDFVRLYDRLATDPRVDPSRLVLVGRSLGGGAVCQMLTKREPAALVLMSTFTSVPDVAKQRMGLPGLATRFIRDRFDSAAVLKAKRVPTFITHGRNDELIPVSHGMALARLSGAELRLEDCGHNDCPLDWSAWVDALRAFLEGVSVLPAGPT